MSDLRRFFFQIKVSCISFLFLCDLLRRRTRLHLHESLVLMCYNISGAIEEKEKGEKRVFFSSCSLQRPRKHCCGIVHRAFLLFLFLSPLYYAKSLVTRQISTWYIGLSKITWPSWSIVAPVGSLKIYVTDRPTDRPTDQQTTD